MVALLLFVGLVALFIGVNWVIHSGMDLLFRKGGNAYQGRAERAEAERRRDGRW